MITKEQLVKIIPFALVGGGIAGYAVTRKRILLIPTGAGLGYLAYVKVVKPVLAKPAIVVTSVECVPSEVIVGHPVTIKICVKNTGTAEGSATITYSYPGYTGTLDTGTLKPREEKELTVTWTPTAPGTFEVVADTQKCTVTVKRVPAKLVVKRIWGEPAETEVGKTVTVKIEIANEGGDYGVRDIWYSYPGRSGYVPYDWLRTIGPGESKVLTLDTFTSRVPGAFTLSASDGKSSTVVFRVTPEQKILKLRLGNGMPTKVEIRTNFGVLDTVQVPYTWADYTYAVPAETAWIHLKGDGRQFSVWKWPTVDTKPLSRVTMVDLINAWPEYYTVKEIILGF
jgi:hypothetical protein